jgi:glycerol dehydrogenase-like iron-containing ADH family enzyme
VSESSWNQLEEFMKKARLACFLSELEHHRIELINGRIDGHEARKERVEILRRVDRAGLMDDLLNFMEQPNK